MSGSRISRKRGSLLVGVWWRGASGHQTLYISRLGEVRTGAGSHGLGWYAVSSIRVMNQFLKELGSSFRFSTVSLLGPIRFRHQQSNPSPSAPQITGAIYHWLGAHTSYSSIGLDLVRRNASACLLPSVAEPASLMVVIRQPMSASDLLIDDAG